MGSGNLYHEEIQLQEIPKDGFEFIARITVSKFREHVGMLETYYEKVDKHSNPQQRAVDTLLDDPLFWESRQGRLQHFCMRGAVRSGKSYLSIIKPMEWLHKFPGTKWLCMRRTNAQLVGSMFVQIKEILTKFRVPFKDRLPSMSGPGEIRFNNGSSFVFWSSETVVIDAKADSARGLGSMEFAGATLEEADTLHKAAVDTVPQRISQQSGCPPVIFYNINPTPKNHWIAVKFRKKDGIEFPEDFHEYKFTLIDNEMHLRPGFVDSVKAACASNPAMYKRNVLGEWGPEMLGDPIYGPYFSKQRHIAPTSFIDRWAEDQLYRDGDVCLCWDFGFKHPALVVFQDVNIGNFRQIRVLGAFLGDSVTLGAFCSYIYTILRINLPNAHFVSYGDPQGRNKDPRGVVNLNAFDVIEQETGLKTQASKTDEVAGIDLIINLLGRQVNHKTLGNQPEIIIEPNEYWTGLFVEMLELGFCQSDTTGKEDKYKPVEDQQYIHVADAWRYGVVHRRAIKQGVIVSLGTMGGGMLGIDGGLVGGLQTPFGRTNYQPVSNRQQYDSFYLGPELLEYGMNGREPELFQRAHYGL